MKYVNNEIFHQIYEIFQIDKFHEIFNHYVPFNISNHVYICNVSLTTAFIGENLSTNGPLNNKAC